MTHKKAQIDADRFYGDFDGIFKTNSIILKLLISVFRRKTFPATGFKIEKKMFLFRNRTLDLSLGKKIRDMIMAEYLYKLKNLMSIGRKSSKYIFDK